MQYEGNITPQLFVSSEGECPYLEGKRERKIFTGLNAGSGAQLNNILSQKGFRRSQNVIYRPSCENCNACLSARVRVADWCAGKRAKRILKRNQDIICEVRTARATQEQFDLFRRYVLQRHPRGGMADMGETDFANMIEGGAVPSRMIEYRELVNGRPGPMVAACLTDVLDDGLSMVYSFFDPLKTNNSLGTHMILSHITLAREAPLAYLYLGYWIKNSPKMAYKSGYRPLEVFTDEAWHEIDPDNFESPHSV